MYFLLVIEQMWFGLWRWNHTFSFSRGVKCLSFYSVLHLSSSIYFIFFLSCICSFFLCMADCMSPYPVEKAGSYHPFLFVLYLFLSMRLETRWQPVSFDRLHLCALLSRLSGFSFLHSKHTPPSIFLFFLNVIVKCSSEMTLNMCTLTEGIHLVIYFLPPLLCGLFMVSFWSSWSLSQFLFLNHTGRGLDSAWFIHQDYIWCTRMLGNPTMCEFNLLHTDCIHFYWQCNFLELIIILYNSIHCTF